MLRNQKGISLIAIVVIVAVIIVGIIIISSNSKPGYEMSVKDKEAVAYTRLRQAIADGNLKGSSTFESEYMAILGKMAKNAESSNQWFSSNSGAFYGGTADTSDYQYTWISNGTYCAVFVVIYEDNVYYLGNYSFKADDVKGCMLFVE